MNWFLIAILSPALWGMTNYVDKYLIEKYFKGGGVGILIIFSSLIGFLMMPLIFIFNPDVSDISFLQAFWIIIAGAIYILGIFAYLNALKLDEASIVVPLFQTIPMFSFILGYIVLDEVLSISQIVGSLLIILGGVLLSLDINNKKTKFKNIVFFLMLVASFLTALSGLIFKIVAIETDFWTTAFWGYIGDILIGILFLVFIRRYRIEFSKVIKENKLSILSLNALNEMLNVIANLILKFVTLLAPLALVWSINGFQPFFVFVYGILITIFFPKIGKETLLKKHLAQKVGAISIMFIGTYVLSN